MTTWREQKKADRKRIVAWLRDRFGGVIHEDGYVLSPCPRCENDSTTLRIGPLELGGLAMCSVCHLTDVELMREYMADGENETEPLAPIPPYPIKALPTAAQALVHAASAAGLPAALVGGAALAAMATAVGASSRLDVLSGERAILWCPLVAPTGAGKSPAQKLAFGPLRAHDAGAEDAERLLLGDMTLEALARELDAVGGSGALDLDELAGLLRGLGEYKRSGGGDRGRFLSLWTGAPWLFTRVAGGRGTNGLRIRVDHPTLVVCGALQSDMHQLLGGDEDGSRARWLPHLASMPKHLENVPAGTAPPAWGDLIKALLAVRGNEREWWLSDKAQPVFAQFRGDWKRQADGIESMTVTSALRKADVHLSRVALVLAEAEDPEGSNAIVSDEVVERAAAIVQFTLDCWRALPANGSLALSRRDEQLDQGVAKLLTWLEDHGGKASKRELQRARVAGARTKDELDALIKRFEATYPGTVTEESSSRGGRATVVVSAPLRVAASSNVT
jgi:hypothetical protein